jgi:protein-disulfide isomerase
VVSLGKKITFDLGAPTIILIVIALVTGIAIGSFLPFFDQTLTTEGSSNDNTGRTTSLEQSQVNSGYGREDLRRWASEIGLETTQFNTCFDSQKYMDDIRSEYVEGLNLGITGTPTFLVGNSKDGMIFLTGAQPFELFKGFIDSYLNGTAPESEFNLIGDPIRNSSVIGDRDAEVLIIEFSDFQCPFCRAFYTETFPQIEREYIDTGKAALVYKEFPLPSIHPGAVDYGLAAKCAQEQGKWREMHDKIFDEQNKLGVDTIPYG